MIAFRNDDGGPLVANKKNSPVQVTETGGLRISTEDDVNTDLMVLALGNMYDLLQAGGSSPTASAIAAAVDGATNQAAMAADLNELTAAPVAKVPVWLAAVIVGEPGTPLVLAADGTFFTYAVLQAGRAAAANTGMISICGNTAYTSQRAIELAPGDTWYLIPPAGTKWDLNDFYIDGAQTLDGVRIMYVAP